MTPAWILGLSVAATLASIPVTAVSYALPRTGSPRLPSRWWCGAPAPPTQAILVAVVTGACTVPVCLRDTTIVALPAAWITTVLGIGLAVTDLRTHRLPHAATGLLWTAWLTCLAVEAAQTGSPDRLTRAAIAAAAVVGLLLLLALALPGQLGLGDINLAGVIAFSLARVSWAAMLLGLLAGLTLQAVITTPIVLAKGSRQTRALGPALMAGWLLAFALVQP
jgi:leader peptidase (prepilin peptidase)/N-methyltransferase